MPNSLISFEVLCGHFSFARATTDEGQEPCSMCHGGTPRVSLVERERENCLNPTGIRFASKIKDVELERKEEGGNPLMSVTTLLSLFVPCVRKEELEAQE